jgi:hypothetical protein
MRSVVSLFACRACRAALAAALAMVVCLPLGCQKKAEKTTDPAKMEQIRQDHLKTSQREMQQSREAQRKKP